MCPHLSHGERHVSSFITWREACALITWREACALIYHMARGMYPHHMARGAYPHHMARGRFPYLLLSISNDREEEEIGLKQRKLTFHKLRHQDTY